MCHGDNSWPCDDVGSYYSHYWGCVSCATWQRGKPIALLQKGKAARKCTHGTYNPVNFTILKPSDWTQGKVVNIKIDKQDIDPASLMHLKLVTVTHESSSY
jgi:hypothetical protein